MSDTTEKIKEKLDVADFIGGYVKLVPAGKNLKGLCPFHKEKSPSFIVSRDRQSWHCFGCGLGGDLISFLMQYENVEFLEALKILADKAGIKLELGASSDQRQYNVLYDINRAAKDIYKKNLFSANSKGAYEYLLKRGLKAETIEAFEIGLSASQSDSLLRALIKEGYNIADIERAGLAMKSDKGMYFDRFRHRIMFPIYNHFDKVVGFTGRILPEHDSDKVGKYVNSPETAIFNKSKILYGFSKAKNAIRESNAAVLVEGQMDLIMLHQDGVLNAVATSGTALTGEHAKILRRFTENLVLSFDNDKAGKLAAERATDLLSAGDFNVKVLLIHDDKLKDPADVVKERPGEMAKLIGASVPAMEYYFEYFGLAQAKTAAEKKKSVRSILAKIKQIMSPVEQAFWLGELAVRTRLSQEVLSMELATLKVNPSSLRAEEERKLDERRTFSRLEAIMQRLIGVASIHKESVLEIEKVSPEFTESYQHLFQEIAKPKSMQLTSEESQLLTFMQLRLSLEPIDLENISTEVKILLQEFKREQIKNKRKELLQHIQTLERAKDQDGLKKALAEYQKITSVFDNSGELS